MTLKNSCCFASTKLWLWCHEAGSHNRLHLPAESRMTPAEAALYMGIPNVIMVKYANSPSPPYHQHALSLSPLRNIIWSIVGDAGCSDTEQEVLLAKDLATSFPNISGFIMDDFFRRKQDSQGVRAPGYTPEELAEIKNTMALPNRKLDLWVVLYDSELDMPIHDHLKHFDGVTFWTWEAEDLNALEENFARLNSLAPGLKKMLGCYMWDYGSSKAMPLRLMEKQCNLGTKWMKEGLIEGMVFLASCICDLELDAVEWTRSWIRETGAAGT